jgi:DNA-binding response OmpR family regulator
MRIAVIEDNDDLRESLVEALVGRGYACVGLTCAEDLGDMPVAGAFELVILDLNLPGEDGLSLAARLKRVQPGLRVIMMTTRSALGDRVRGYEAGADLYLPKPVAEDELFAAVRALERQIRSGLLNRVDGGKTGLQLVPEALQVRGPKGAASLSAVEVALLLALARSPTRRLEHWQLIEAIGLEVDDPGKANLAVRMSRLRGKIAQAGYPDGALRSLRAEGYQLCVPLEIC